MKKIFATVLTLICVLGLIGCSPMDDVPTLEAVKEYSAEDFNEHFEGVNREGLIEVWGDPAGSMSEENADMWDIDDESMVVIYWKDNGKFKDAEISIKETAPAPADGECIELPDIEADTVQFHDKTLNKSDLSAETLAWLERYNALSSEEQLAISSIPKDLYDLCGYGEATEEIAPSEIEPIDYSPMIMFNDILYTATNYTGDKEDLTMVGEIESCIDYGMPTENNQANDNLVGCEIYASSSIPDYIFVLYDGEYSPYKSIGDAGIE